MAQANVRYPVDGEGKRVTQKAHLEIPFASLVTDFVVGSTVTTDAGMSGKVIRFSKVGTAGTIQVLLDFSSLESIAVSTTLKVSGVTYATSSAAGVPYYTNNMVMVGANDPLTGQFVGPEGAAYMRFAEGSQQFDAIGRSRVSAPYKLGNYNYHYDKAAGLWTLIKVGTTGAETLDTVANVVKLSLGTPSGDKVTRRTNKWHKVVPGVGVSMTLEYAAGDSGKAGLIRRWGYNDDRNGPHFRQTGTGELEVVMRSDATGAVVDTAILRSQWNQDKADGTGISGFNLDVTKSNIYFIDEHWLGAVSARLGVYDQTGSRVVLHEFTMVNTHVKSFSRTGSLPLSFEMENTALTASVSECYAGKATVELEGSFSPRSRLFTAPSAQKALTNTATIMAVLRPKLTFNARDNRCIVLPVTLDVAAWSGANDSLVLIEIIMDATLTGGTFASVDSASSVDASYDVTSFTGGKVMFRVMVKGNDRIDLDKVFAYDSQHMVNFADLTLTQTNMIIAAKTLKSAETAECLASIQWNEVRD